MLFEKDLPEGCDEFMKAKSELLSSALPLCMCECIKAGPRSRPCVEGQTTDGQTDDSDFLLSVGLPARDKIKEFLHSYSEQTPQQNSYYPAMV